MPSSKQPFSPRERVCGHLEINCNSGSSPSSIWKPSPLVCLEKMAASESGVYDIISLWSPSPSQTPPSSVPLPKLIRMLTWVGRPIFFPSSSQPTFICLSILSFSSPFLCGSLCLGKLQPSCVVLSIDKAFLHDREPSMTSGVLPSFFPPCTIFSFPPFGKPHILLLYIW